jgi:hypothetical protein
MHVERMEKNGLPKEVLLCECQGRRNVEDLEEDGPIGIEIQNSC